MIFWLSYGILWGVALVQLLALLVLVHRSEALRGHADLAAPVRGEDPRPLPKGATAPRFSAVSLPSGRGVHSSELMNGKSIYLLFLSVDCLDCKRVIAGLKEAGPAALKGLVVYCVGDRSHCEQQLGSLASSLPVLTRGDADVASIYQISGTPMGVSIDAERRISGTRSPSSAEEVVAHLEELRSRSGAVSDGNSITLRDDATVA